jgi:hypothetical protein
MNPRQLAPILGLTLFSLPFGGLGAQEPAPEGFELRGTVYLGERPVAARLEFLEGGGGVKREVESDLAGHYTLAAGGVLRQVKIELRDRPGRFFYEFFPQRIEAAAERDFRLPDTELQVKLIDAATGQGVPEAALRLRNDYRLVDKTGQPIAPKTAGAAPPTSSVAQAEKTGKNGEATFYYLRPGEVEIGAVAEGYKPADAPLKLAIAEGSKKHQVEIRLQPQAKKAGLLILLPDGKPFELLASATAGKDGRARLPEEMAGAWIGIHHPEGAFHLGHWQPAGAPNDAEIKLEKAAEKPLVVRATIAGEKLAYAEVVLWAGGQRLATQLLYQLTGAKPMTDEEGIFTAATSLPRGAVKILVFSRQDPGRADQARTGRHDDRAAEIPYPWPPLVEVEGLD